jgi:hypothetical protein
VSARSTLAALALAAAPLLAAAESPKYGTVEVRVSSFRPDRDAEFDGAATPYADDFGTKRGWFPKVLASWTLFDRFVQVDAGLGTGWFRAKGKGQYVTGGASGDTTTFSIIPLTAALTLRVDGFAENWSVPLDVYGRVALERYHWLVTDGTGGVTEKGATNGYSFAGGVGLLLDVIDSRLARELDAETGINQTWIYFEVEKNVVDDFGSSTSWILSDEKLTLSGGFRFVF